MEMTQGEAVSAFEQSPKTYEKAQWSFLCQYADNIRQKYVRPGVMSSLKIAITLRCLPGISL